MVSRSDDAPVVLIVDDEEASLKARAAYFKQSGLAVLTADNFETAISTFRNCAYIDLVVTDIHLSQAQADKSGISLARWIKDIKPTIPIVGYSAYFDSEELANDDLVAFDLVHYKGSLDLDGVRQALEQCCNMATRSFRRRKEARKLHSNLTELTRSDAEKPVMNSVEGMDSKSTTDAFYRNGSDQQQTSLLLRQIAEKLHLTNMYSWIIPVGFIIGTLACAVILILVMKQPNPTIPQLVIFRIVLALGGAAFSMALTGFITIRMNLPGKGYIIAGGTLAVFLVLFFFSPDLGLSSSSP